MIKIGVFSSNGKMGKALIHNLRDNQSVVTIACSKSYNDNQITLNNGQILEKQNISFPNINNILYTNSINTLCRNSDVVIDFSNSIFLNEILDTAVIYDTKLVIGTTGFTQMQNKMLESYSSKIPILYSENMSMGIQLLHKAIAHISKNIPKCFDIGISEIHHKHKQDSPSGTAIMLGKAFNSKKDIAYSSLRVGKVYGEHSVIIDSEEETITLSHKAKNRDIFAKGAIQAATWLYGHNTKGRLYSLSDILDK